MRALRTLLVALHCAACVPAWADGAGIALVSNAQGMIQTLSRDEAEQLYLGRLSALRDGTPVRLLDLPASLTRDRFYQSLIQKNSAQTRAYWSRMVFTGRARPPREMESIEQAVAAVRRDPHLIAYLPIQAVPDDLRTLLTLE